MSYYAYILNVYKLRNFINVRPPRPSVVPQIARVRIIRNPEQPCENLDLRRCQDDFLRRGIHGAYRREYQKIVLGPGSSESGFRFLLF